MNPPVAIPGYTLLAEAGRGGMGVVYKAEQASPRRLVALKLLTAVRPDAAELAAFRREAQLIARLEHPHILPVYDFGEVDGIPYLVMRYLEGGSLAHRLHEGAVPPATAVRWLRQVADALDFAHREGFVHKDVKPSNVLLDSSGQAYLTDFGIADTLQAPGQNVPLGSAAYMAPEQARGRQVDARADVYALSVLLFELLTGRKPYLAESAMGMLVRHMKDPIPSARELNPAVSPAMDELIWWGMAKEPGDRLATAAEFATLLQKAVARPEAPLRQIPAAPPAQAAPAPRRPLLLAGVAGIVLLAFCLLAAVTLTGGALLFTAAATPTAIPTATRAPTPTAGAGAGVTPAALLLADDFSRPGSGFAVSSDEDGGVAYNAGGLEFTVLRPGVEWLSPSRRVDAADVVVEVVLEQLVAAPEAYAAVICRWQDRANYTAFGLNSNGEFSIWQKRGGEVYPLAAWQPAPGVIPGNRQQLRLTCAGRTLRYVANNILLAEIDDPQPATGDVAFLAGLMTSGEYAVRFHDLTVRRPGEQ
jgi:hypothetical protein